MGSKMLRGRFKGEMSPKLKEYTSSIDSDKDMFLEDIWGSTAHVVMLARQGIINPKEAARITAALEKIKDAYQKGTYKLKAEQEDIHLNIENAISKECGPNTGGKMHTARSRNDQVLTASRLHLRAESLEIMKNVLELQRTLLGLGEKYIEQLMPGFTHMQHAQPITAGYWLTSYASSLGRDYERLESAYARINLSPLGAGALSGTSFPIDRKYTAKLLGFDGLQEHALDTVSTRDITIELVSAAAILMTNLSKISEDLIIMSTKEFGYIEFSDAYATGSSIMPQKKNPDLAELVRGKTGRVIGALMQILTVTKGIPAGYNRDLQEDRAYLWSSLAAVKNSLIVLEEGLKDIKIDKERMETVTYSDYSTATELANYLVRKEGMAFREAYDLTGGAVKDLISKGKDFRDVKYLSDVLKKEGIDISDKELYDVLDPGKAVYRNNSIGGCSPTEVARMIKDMREAIKERGDRLNGRNLKIEAAKKMTEKAVNELI